MKKIFAIILMLNLVWVVGCANNRPHNGNNNEEVEPTPKQEDVKNNKQKESEKAAMYHNISQEDAKAMMDEGNVIVIDVREQSEYDSGHIVGAILSPVGNIKNDISNITTNKNDVILIYCRSGNRSRTATNELVELGYTEVYDFGGINTWAYEIEK